MNGIDLRLILLDHITYIDHYLLQLNPTVHKSSYFNLTLLQYCNAVVGVETILRALHLPAIDAVDCDQTLRHISLSNKFQFFCFSDSYEDGKVGDQGVDTTQEKYAKDILAAMADCKAP